MRSVKCKKCRHKIRVQDYLERKDYIKITNNEIEIYCDICGNIELVKLDKAQEEEVR